MSLYNLPLVSWANGTVMIGVFVLVVVGLILAVYLLMNSDKKANWIRIEKNTTEFNTRFFYV